MAANVRKAARIALDCGWATFAVVVIDHFPCIASKSLDENSIAESLRYHDDHDSPDFSVGYIRQKSTGLCPRKHSGSRRQPPPGTNSCCCNAITTTS
ncbi:hypothetical protein [Cryobacterium sp. Hz9]|uniref:hypothetical protein n=1 Tax=Cryobacterium sp. Hz9 TaxID=1259167 RepID=UPI00141B9757|nr:hypothetical protein [Cryobacterium sp. Hz9]